MVDSEKRNGDPYPLPTIHYPLSTIHYFTVG
jgi:hypothetical protein